MYCDIRFCVALWYYVVLHVSLVRSLGGTNHVNRTNEIGNEQSYSTKAVRVLCFDKSQRSARRNANAVIICDSAECAGSRRGPAPEHGERQGRRRRLRRAERPSQAGSRPRWCMSEKSYRFVSDARLYYVYRLPIRSAVRPLRSGDSACSESACPRTDRARVP